MRPVLERENQRAKWRPAYATKRCGNEARRAVRPPAVAVEGEPAVSGPPQDGQPRTSCVQGGLCVPRVLGSDRVTAHETLLGSSQAGTRSAETTERRTSACICIGPTFAISGLPEAGPLDGRVGQTDSGTCTFGDVAKASNGGNHPQRCSATGKGPARQTLVSGGGSGSAQGSLTANGRAAQANRCASLCAKVLRWIRFHTLRAT